MKAFKNQKHNLHDHAYYIFCSKPCNDWIFYCPRGGLNQWYTVVRREICDACTLLADTLILVGNADHGLVQEVSVLQLWRRMFNTIQLNPTLNKQEWIRLASRGCSHELQKCAEFMTDFVLKHSDVDGSVLSELERYEQRIASSRKIPPTLFRQLGDVPIHILRGPWVIAMLKAIMRAPNCYQPSLFSTADVTEGKLTSLKDNTASSASYIASARLYLKAHLVPAKITDAIAVKLIDDLELLC